LIITGMTLHMSLVQISSSPWLNCSIQCTCQAPECQARIWLHVKLLSLVSIFGWAWGSYFSSGQLSVGPLPFACNVFLSHPHCISDDWFISDIPAYLHISVICLRWEVKVKTWTYS
jgi:hypothetical protein